MQCANLLKSKVATKREKLQSCYMKYKGVSVITLSKFLQPNLNVGRSKECVTHSHPSSHMYVAETHECCPLSLSGATMPITLLWAVDVYGRVYSLSTAGQRWVRAEDLLLELKRVTAGRGRCWGIGCDHHIYMNIMPSETSIRYREETYENQVSQKNNNCFWIERVGWLLNNAKSDYFTMYVYCQRWNPVDGFTDVLLPTDRWPWSDVTGMNPQPLHSFQLPSRSWEWEGDWYVDQSCGEPSQTGVRNTRNIYQHFVSSGVAYFFWFLFLLLFEGYLINIGCEEDFVSIKHYFSHSVGLGVCCRFSGQLLSRQEVELLCSS